MTVKVSAFAAPKQSRPTPSWSGQRRWGCPWAASIARGQSCLTSTRDGVRPSSFWGGSGGGIERTGGIQRVARLAAGVPAVWWASSCQREILAVVLDGLADLLDTGSPGHSAGRLIQEPVGQGVPVRDPLLLLSRDSPHRGVGTDC